MRAAAGTPPGHLAPERRRTGYWAMPDLIAQDCTTLGALARHVERGSLYAVLDACDEPRIPARMRELGDHRAVSLYRGSAEADLAAIAPYLAAVDGLMLEWIAAHLWTAPWGIFAVSDAGLEAVRTHFRKFLLVDAPDGDKWYFRFYDPRVLARFLPTCDAGQLTDFFGPVSAYGWTDTETYGVTLTRQAWFDAPAPSRPRVTLRRS